MSDVITYFAYGSNMFTPRLRYRAGGCVPVGPAILRAHRLCFHKRSKDGSGKCNALSTDNPDDLVHGVMFTVPKTQLAELHRAEGRGSGYEDRDIYVTSVDGAAIKALTYLASPAHIDDDLQPYTWYRDFVVLGAREHCLPQYYIDHFVEAVAAIADPDMTRDTKERAKVLVIPHG